MLVRLQHRILEVGISVDNTNWYNSFKKTAQHSNVEVYTNPKVDGGNPYANKYVDVIHVPYDPYYRQKDIKKERQQKYDYFLSERNRVSKRTAVEGVNRLAKAVNALVQAKQELGNALGSDEYHSLRRLIKSIVVEDEQEDNIKKTLIAALQSIEDTNGQISGIESGLPVSYNAVSTYVDQWIRKDADENIMKRKRFIHTGDGNYSDTLPLK